MVSKGLGADGLAVAAAAIIGTPIGVLVGGIGGALAGTDKKIQIEGMTEWEILEALNKLRKKARIRDYR